MQVEVPEWDRLRQGQGSRVRGSEPAPDPALADPDPAAAVSGHRWAFESSLA